LRTNRAYGIIVRIRINLSGLNGLRWDLKHGISEKRGVVQSLHQRIQVACGSLIFYADMAGFLALVPGVLSCDVFLDEILIILAYFEIQLQTNEFDLWWLEKKMVHLDDY
jgi:hypothetical protein